MPHYFLSAPGHMIGRPMPTMQNAVTKAFYEKFVTRRVLAFRSHAHLIFEFHGARHAARRSFPFIYWPSSSLAFSLFMLTQMIMASCRRRPRKEVMILFPRPARLPSRRRWACCQGARHTALHAPDYRLPPARREAGPRLAARTADRDDTYIDRGMYLPAMFGLL